MSFMLSCTMTMAQQIGYQNAVAKYKNVSSLTATATKTTHKAAVAKDAVKTGTLYVKGTEQILISFDKGKDALMMNGETFVMIVKGMKFPTNTKKDAMFGTFHDVLQSVFAGGTTDITKRTDVKSERKGSNIVFTITPTSSGKDTKKQRYTSFMLTIDASAHELRSIRLNGKKGSYTDYTFSNYKLGADVPASLFKQTAQQKTSNK